VWPYRETDSLGGYDPYSSSKACAELLSAAYRSSFFPVEKLAEHQVGLATARAGNVIGGGDWSVDRLIPDLVRGFKAKQDVLIRCPKASRPWQHVLEPLHGYMMLAEQLLEQNARAMSAFNFGPDAGDVWPVDRIATSIARMWGEEARWVCDAAPTLHEAGALSLDASKARAELGWRPELGLELALEWTVAWYRASLDGEDMGDKTREQIKAYEEIIH
jgi:CDP-glucose 4,6-dehydratase